VNHVGNRPSTDFFNSLLGPRHPEPAAPGGGDKFALPLKNALSFRKTGHPRPGERASLPPP
ncbi:MAG: hypothetical protein WD270_11575, partial [Acetobacterales bacterium]